MCIFTTSTTHTYDKSAVESQDDEERNEETTEHELQLKYKHLP